jgi:hypothetical protein
MTATGRRGTLLVALLALLWGSNFLWVKVALDGLSPALITFSRLATGVLVVFVLVRARGERLPRDRSTIVHLAVAALFANAAPYLLFAVGEQIVDSALAGILSATTPLWTVLVAVASRHERNIGRSQAAGIAVGFAGTLLIFQPWSSGASGTFGGQLACLAAAACYGVSYVYMSRHLAPRGAVTACSRCRPARRLDALARTHARNHARRRHQRHLVHRRRTHRPRPPRHRPRLRHQLRHRHPRRRHGRFGRDLPPADRVHRPRRRRPRRTNQHRGRNRHHRRPR